MSDDDNYVFENGTPFRGMLGQGGVKPKTIHWSDVQDPEDFTPKTQSDGWSTDYYQVPEGTKELQDLIEHKGMNFAIGNIFKACYRLGHKQGHGRAYDLNKIIWFAQRELARCQNET